MNSKPNNDRSVQRDDSVDVREIVNVFLRRRRLFVFIAVPVFLGIIIAQLIRPFTPIYKATFDLGINERPVEDLLSPGMAETPLAQISNVSQRVISNLLSVSLSQKVADTLGLYAHAKNGISDIKVYARIKEDFKKAIGPLRLLIGDSTFLVLQSDGTSRQFPLDSYVDFGRFELKVSKLAPVSDVKVYDVTIYPRERIALALRNSLAIKVLDADKVEQDIGTEAVPFSGEGTQKKLLDAKTIFPGMNLIGMLRIDVHWSNPGDALKIAQSLSEQIIAHDVMEKSLLYKQRKGQIDSQMVVYRQELSDIEEKMRSFKQQQKITDLGASTYQLISQVSELESRRNDLDIEQRILTDLSVSLAATRAVSDELPDFASALASSDVLKDVYSQLMTTEAELKSMLKRYSENHPEVIELRNKFEVLKQQMQEQIGKRIPAIRAEIQSVEKKIVELEMRLKSVPDDEISLARLERDRETKETQYLGLSERLDDVRVMEAGITSDLSIVNPPMVSDSPVNSRRRLLTLFLAIVVSVLAGGFAVFVGEYIDNSVKDPDALVEKTGLAIFGTIPAIDTPAAPTSTVIVGRRPKRKPGDGSALTRMFRKMRFVFLGAPLHFDHDGLKILDQNVGSPEFEAFRKLAMNLEFAHPDKKYQAIYVTSPGPEEGKTFTAVNLGLVYARTGKRVLLIDTDFRKKAGHMSDVTKSKHYRGLFDVLKGKASLDEVIRVFSNDHTHNSHPIRTSLAPGADSVKQQAPIVSGESGIGFESETAVPPGTESPVSSINILPIGALPANPFIFLESERMRNIIRALKSRYDFVIIDGVPILLFADAAYLANYTDGVLLTARYGRTDMKDLSHAKEILSTAKVHIIGLVVNGVPKTRGSYYYQYYHKYYDKYYKT